MSRKRLLVAIPMLSVVGAALVGAAALARERSTLPDDLAELRRLGYVTSVEEFVRPDPPVDENAAPLIQALHRLVEDRSLRPQINAVHRGAAPTASPAVHASARASLRELTDLVRLAEQAADRPSYYVRRNWHRKSFIDFREQRAFRVAGELLTVKARRQSDAGDWAGALMSVERCARLARHVGQEPALWGFSGQISLEEAALHSLGWVIQRHGAHPGFRREARRILDRLGPLPNFHRAIGGEIALMQRALSQIGSWSFVNGDARALPEPVDRVVYHTVKGAVEARFVHAFRKVAADIPAEPERWPEARQAMKRLDAQVRADRSLLAGPNRTLMYTTTFGADAVGRIQTLRLLVHTSLELAEGGRTLPADPFGKGPLRLTSGNVLYSVGENRRDDGGRPNLDLVVKVPATDTAPQPVHR